MPHSKPKSPAKIIVIHVDMDWLFRVETYISLIFYIFIKYFPH